MGGVCYSIYVVLYVCCTMCVWCGVLGCGVCVVWCGCSVIWFVVFMWYGMRVVLCV